MKKFLLENGSSPESETTQSIADAYVFSLIYSLSKVVFVRFSQQIG